MHYVSNRVQTVTQAFKAKQRTNEKKESQFRDLKSDFEVASKDYERRIALLKQRMAELEEEAEECRRQRQVAEKRYGAITVKA